MKLFTKISNKKKGTVKASFNGIMCLFDRNCNPPSNTFVNVMISGYLFYRDADHQFDFERRPFAIFVEPITEDHVLIEHQGFSVMWPMCSVTATSKCGRYVIVPKKTHPIVADRIKNIFQGVAPALTPAKIWIKKTDLKNDNLIHTIEAVGLERIEDSRFGDLILATRLSQTTSNLIFTN